MRLFYYCKNVGLAYDGVLYTVDLNLGTAVLTGDYLISDLESHLDLITVDETAGAYRYDLGHLRLLLCGAGKQDACLRGLLNLYLLQYYLIKQGFKCQLYFLL